MSKHEAARLAGLFRRVRRFAMAEDPATADHQLHWLSRRAEVRSATRGKRGAVVLGDGAFIVWRDGEVFTTSARPAWLTNDQIVRLPERQRTDRQVLERLRDLGAAITREDADIGRATGVDSALAAVRSNYGEGGRRAAESIVDEAFGRMLGSCGLEQQPAGSPPKVAIRQWLSESAAALLRAYLDLQVAGNAAARLVAAIAVQLEATEQAEAVIYRLGPAPANLEELERPVEDVGTLGYSVLLAEGDEPRTHRVAAGRPPPELAARWVVPLALGAFLAAPGGDDHQQAALRAAARLQERADEMRDRARSELSFEAFGHLLYAALLLYKAALYIYRSVSSPSPEGAEAVRVGDLICEEMRVLIVMTLSQCVDDEHVDFGDPAKVVGWALHLRTLPPDTRLAQLADASRDLRAPRFLVSPARGGLVRAMLDNQDPSLRNRAIRDLRDLESRLTEHRRSHPGAMGEANYLAVTEQALAETAELAGLHMDAANDPETSRSA